MPRSGVLKVVAGDPAELGCEVTQGSPRPEITWKREVREKGRRELRARLVISNCLSVSTIRLW